MNRIKKILSTILVTSVCLSGLQGISTQAQDDTNEPIKIMCVGDSITDGYGLQGSYRKYLYRNLTENGFNIDMVGAYGNNEESIWDGTATFSYDGNYTAVSGYAIQQMTSGEYRNGIFETIRDGNVMQNCQPNIVLLQIGTNDIISNYNDGIIDRLENLVNYLIENMDEDGTVFVTTIPYMDANNNEVYSWFSHYDDYYQISQEELAQEIIDCIDSYNTQIKDMVTRKQSEGCKNIQFADVNSVVDYKTELRDGVHPNDKGYQDMGNYWNKVLTEYLGNQPIVSETTTEETTTIDITTSTENTTETSITEPTTTEVSTTTSYYEESSTYDTTITFDTTTTPDTTTITTLDTTTTTEPPVIDYSCDINQDGNINFLDLIMVKKYILGISTWYNADVNNDNATNILDCIYLKNKLLENI